jgi:hypothetical protein
MEAGSAVQTGIGPAEVQQPRVEDRLPGEAFTSRILPPYMRRIPCVDALIRRQEETASVTRT